MVGSMRFMFTLVSLVLKVREMIQRGPHRCYVQNKPVLQWRNSKSFGEKNKQTNKNSSLFPFLFGFGFGLPRWHSVQALGCVQLIVTPWTAVRQASLSITNSQSLLKLMSTQSVMPSSYVILCHPFLLPPSIFPSIRVFSNESILRIR